MTRYIQKINLIHSIIFILVATFISVLFDQNQKLTISPFFCFLLILTVGISHGSLDHLKGEKILNIFNINKKSLFYLSYILISLFIIFIWTIFPLLMLIIFLIIASYHFGKEDSDFLVDKKNYLNEFFYFLKGLLIIVTPLIFHFDETVNIFKVLLVENEKFYVFLGFIESSKILFIIFLVSMSGYFYFFIKNFKIANFSLYLDFFSILILNYFLNPLIAFTIYFCLLHSFRHTVSLAVELDSNNLKKGLLKFIKKALPLTIITAILFILSLFILSSYYVLDDAISKVIFIGLASLTFPHILLEYLVEKNEK